jgi:hypothetical protein
MKKIFLTLIAIYIFHIAFSQNTKHYLLISPAIQANSILNTTEFVENKIQFYNKLEQLITPIPGIILDPNSDYYLISDIKLIDKKESSAGMMKVGLYKIEMSIKLSYKNSSKIFNEINISKEFASNSINESIHDFIVDLNIDKEKLTSFFDQGKNQVDNFYSENCEYILQDIIKYKKMGAPEKALAICIDVPTNHKCYKKVFDQIEPLYTSISYKLDYQLFLNAQELSSRFQYQEAFEMLSKISIYSKFYKDAQELGQQINKFVFKQAELEKQREVLIANKELIAAETELQAKKNELQQSINETNIRIAADYNQSQKETAREQMQNKIEIKNRELQSAERQQLIKTAGSLLGAYINRPVPARNTNFYIIK